MADNSNERIDLVVPDLGEFSDVEVIEILVAIGDEVAPEDGLITIETDKATMDVPAPRDGVISSLSIAVGNKVSSGDVIGSMDVKAEATVDDSSGETNAAPAVSPTVDDPPPAQEVRQMIEVPDLGDFNDVEVIEVHVSVGDTVAVDDPLVTLETDKAAMEVPASAAGKIESVMLEVGDKVSKGSPVVEIIGSLATPAPAEKIPSPTPATRQAPPAVQQVPSMQASTKGLPPIDEAGFSRAHASPSVRKLARELGVDLAQVKGSGQKSRITHDDVKAFVKAVMTGGAAVPGGGLPKVPSVDFSKFGDIETQPLTRIQKISGPRLQASWVNLPHVTQHDLADITDLESRRQKLKGPAKEKGIGLTPLAFIMKACIAALKEFPKVNSSLSEDGDSLVLKQYFHLGFAADTENGLMVPVIRNADRLDVYELAAELGALSAKARDGKLKGTELQGASFTISSLGGIGGTAFTPIVNAPEVAILGVSKSSMQPVWNGEEFEPRLMLPISFSYDHRVIDGAYAVRFTTFLCQQLGDVNELLGATL